MNQDNSSNEKFQTDFYAIRSSDEPLRWGDFEPQFVFFTLIVKLSWVSNCFMIRSSEAGSGHNEGRGRGAQNVNWWRSTTSDCPTVSLGLLHHHHHRYHQYNHHQPHSSLNIHNVGNLQRYFRELSLLLWEKFKVRLRSDHGQYKLNFFWQSKAVREKLLSFCKFHIKGLYFLQKLSLFYKGQFWDFEFFFIRMRF